MQNTARVLALALSFLTAVYPAVAQQFPTVFPPNTLYGRLGSTPGPGQAIPLSRIQGAVSAAIVGGTITGTAITGGTINGAAIASAAITAGTISGAAITNGSASGMAISGGTISSAAISGGTITNLGLPVNSGDAANKQYVDSFVQGLIVQPQVTYATAAVLPNTPTYSNGTLGVGATLTAGANSTLTVDGSVVALNTFVLVKNQASAFQNGLYKLTTAGDGSNAWVLTRATYFDQAAEMVAKSYVFATAGTANTNTAWVLQTAVTTVGTDTLTWNLYSNVGGNYWTLSGSDVYRSSGNIGVGNAPSAWGGPWKAVQIGSGAFSVNTSDVAVIYSNTYFDGSVFKYINNGTGGLVATNDGGGAFNVYTFPSGTAGGTATPTNRLGLSNLGILTLGGYGAGVANLSASGVVSSKPGYTKSTFYCADYGMIGNDVSFDATSAFQACITAAEVNGGIAQLPAGRMRLDSGVTCTKPITINGVGMGAGPSVLDPTHASTLLVNFAAGDVIACTGFYGQTFSNFAMVSNVGYRSSGAGIHIKGVADPNDNARAVVSGVAFNQMFISVFCDQCFWPTIEKCLFNDITSGGIHIKVSTVAAAEAGGGNIQNNMFFDLANHSSANIELHTGYTNVIHNLAAGGQIFLKWVVDVNDSGRLLIQSNVIENMQVAGIYATNSGSSVASMFMALDNEFSSFAASQQGSIVIAGGTGSGWLNQIIISRNITRSESTVGVGGYAFINVQAGQNIQITNNSINSTISGASNIVGILVDSASAAPALVADNTFTGTLTQPRYVLGTNVVLRDLIGLPAAALGSWANGSQVFVTDTNVNTFRQAGAWKNF